jgi:hypothetical protein
MRKVFADAHYWVALFNNLDQSHAAAMEISQRLQGAVTGAFGPTTTLDGTALGSNSNFSFQATFDPTAETIVERGVATFATSLSINFAGYGTYTNAPRAVTVVLTDPVFPNWRCDA